MGQKTTDTKLVATLTIENAPTMTTKEAKMLVAWLRRTADALLTKERLELSKNFEAKLYQFKGE